jgi:hypothetical protein
MMTSDNLKTGAFFQQMERRVVLIADGDILDSDYQIAQNLSHDLFSGYMASTLGNPNNHNRYIWNDQWLNSTYNFAFTGIMAPWKQLHEIAEEQNLSEVDALATVVKVAGMHRIADSYGPIPYISYGSNGLYDSLEDIYKRFFEELDNAIDVLSAYASTGGSLLSDYDLVYSGDVTKWVKFANTLRLRLAIRCSYANATLAKTEAEKCMDVPQGFIESSSDRAQISSGYHHPLYVIAYEFNGGDTRPNAMIVSYMNGFNDPRRSAYFTTAADGEYHGVRLGINTSNAEYKGSNISNIKMDRTTTPIVWMTAAESFFLRAEGALRGWNMGGDAKTLYEEGVAASFTENNVGSAASYLADNTSVPGGFNDNIGSDSYAFSSTITPAWDDSASFEGKLERIITQKWIAIFPDGPEGWSELRRTHYPQLLPVVQNGSNNTISTDLGPRRLPYTLDEKTNNAAGVASGISKLGGADNGGTNLWWDKK